MNSMGISTLVPTSEVAQQNPRLVSAAHEFEASLMKEFLKPLQQDTLFSEDGSSDGEETSGSAATLMNYGSEVMAKAISEHGGFGIAREILDHFKMNGNPMQGNSKNAVDHF